MKPQKIIFCGFLFLVEESACLSSLYCYLQRTDRIRIDCLNEAAIVEKQFLDYLDDSFNERFRCEFETHKGKVSCINVVQYETRLRDRWVAVVRYDTAHGFFHRDVYVSQGRKRLKEIVHYLSLEEALTSAIRDLRQNWKKYKTVFLGNGYGNKND